MAEGSGDKTACVPSKEELIKAENEARAISADGLEEGDVRLVINNKTSAIIRCPQNYVNILMDDRYLRGKIRMNALDGRIHISNVYWNIHPHSFRENDLSNIRTYISSVYGLQSKNEIADAIAVVAYQNQYHPIVDKLNSLKWDGTHRIGELFPRYLGAERSGYTTDVTTLILSGAIQRVFDMGCKFDYMAVLKDEQQGSGKSTIVRLLALADEWYTDNRINLKNTDKAFEAIFGHWIVEVGEMQMTKKEDIDAIKAFVTQRESSHRVPYDRYPETYPRQFIMIGTTNRPIFLPDDPTGNRRFLPIICSGRKAERHPLDDEAETKFFIEQCYAEMMVKRRAEGVALVLDSKHTDQVEALQAEAAPEDARIGIIQAYLDREKPKWICSTMIWYEAFNRKFGIDGQPKKYELTEISNLIDINIREYKHYRGKDGTGKSSQHRFPLYGRQRAWERVEEPEVSSGGDRG